MLILLLSLLFVQLVQDAAVAAKNAKRSIGDAKDAKHATNATGDAKDAKPAKNATGDAKDAKNATGDAKDAKKNATGDAKDAKPGKVPLCDPKKKPSKQLTFVAPKDEAKKRDKGFFSPTQYFAISGSQNNTACGTNLSSCCYSCSSDVPPGCTATECCLPNKVCDPVATQPCCNSSDKCLQSSVNGSFVCTACFPNKVCNPAVTQPCCNSSDHCLQSNGSFVCTPCLEVGVACNNSNDLCCNGSVCFDAGGNGSAICVPCVNNNTGVCQNERTDPVDSTCCSDAPLCYPNDVIGTIAPPTCHSCFIRNFDCFLNQSNSGCCNPNDVCAPFGNPRFGFCVPPVCYNNSEQCIPSYVAPTIPGCCDPDYQCIFLHDFDQPTCEKVNNCVAPPGVCTTGGLECCATFDCVDTDGDGIKNCTPPCRLEGMVCDFNPTVNQCCVGSCVEAGIIPGVGTCQ